MWHPTRLGPHRRQTTPHRNEIVTNRVLEEAANLRIVRPLSGVRVLDLSRIVAGPTCCFGCLARAEVLRIEAPGGDVSWQTRPFIGPAGESDTQLTDRDIAMSPLRKARASAAWCSTCVPPRCEFRGSSNISDVLIENFKPGTLARLGFDAGALEARNPRLIYATITGYGHDGPTATNPRWIPSCRAMSG